MTRILGFLSEKIPDRTKITASFSADLRLHLFAYSLIIICMETSLLVTGTIPVLSGDALAPSALGSASPAFPRVFFALAAMSLFFVYCLLDHTFSLFVRGRAAALFPLLPAVLLFLMMQKTQAPLFLSAAVVTAAAAGLFFAVIPQREKVLLYGIFALDAAALYLYFGRGLLSGGFVTDKLLFVTLVIQTLASLQQLLFEAGGTAFPFLYFALLGAMIAVLPMRQSPIDWTPVAAAGERAVHMARDMADSISYYLSSVWGGSSYTTGYSSLGISGGKLEHSDRTQIILETAEMPYHDFVDEVTSAKMQVRRTLYLAGGRGVDRQKLVSFLRFLHASGVDREYASLFSRVSGIDVEYAYLDTADEIAPANSILLYAVDPRSDSAGPNVTPKPAGTGAGGNSGPAGTAAAGSSHDADGTRIVNGTGSMRHQKGYRIKSLYLDIDYGSPYLTGLLSGTDGTLSYSDACDYFMELYRMDLGSILTEEEYEEAADESFGPDDLSTEGAGGRMKELADTLTGGALCDYDKCRLIEGYLRQYTYTTDAAGGHDPRSNMSTAEGMSDIADRFLFETGAGYCVHFTSSMIMLLRLSGIPARAVAGYRYVFPFEKADAYEVSGDCSHIWPEAYLDHVGWVPFEPTSAYRTAADYTWHRRSAAVPSGEQAQSASVPSLSALPAVPSNIYDSSGAGQLPNAGADPSADPASGPDVHPISRIMRIALPVILSIIVLFSALILGTSAAARLRYLRGTPELKLIMDVEMIKKGIRRQSLDDFADRGLLSDYAVRAPEALRPDIQRVFGAYYRVVYGKGDTGSGSDSGAAGTGTSSDAAVTSEENELARMLREQLTDRKKFFRFTL